MRDLLAGLAVLALAATGARAELGTLARVRADGVLRCGSAIRPGLAFPAVDHSWHGLQVELCHAVAAAVLGDDARVEFNGYALQPDFDRVRTGADEVSFLTATELFANELFGAVLPGPTVFQLGTHVMVWDSSPIRHATDLSNTMICGEPGTAAERNLRAYADAQHWTPNVSAWMELEEMMDAFNVGRCPAVIGEATALAALRIGSEHEGHPSRLLPEPLAVTPVMAATPGDDPEWARVVTWTLNTVLAGDAARTLSVPGQWLGLDKAWQSRVLALGTYPELMRRTVGDELPLGLAPGVNAAWTEGGLRATPTIE